jgi:hypothetical protein
MAEKGFLALIIPMNTDARPDNTLPGGGSGIGGGAGERPDHTLPGDLPHPEHPIYWPLPPGAPVDPEYGIPEGGPVDPGWSGGVAPPGQEGGAPRPDHDLPQHPYPEHPIVLPPGNGGWLPVYIDNTLPGGSSGIGGGAGERPDNTLPGTDPGWSGGVAPPGQEGGAPRPTHPIVLPPDTEVPPAWGIEGTIKFKAIWTPDNGWQTIAVIIPGTDGEGRPIPTPSKRRK